MSNSLKELGKSLDIELPGELDQVIHQAIGRGQRKMKKRNSMLRGFKTAAFTLVFCFAVVTAGINTLPAFAETLMGIEGLSGIVRVLQFERGQTAGGEITDGQVIGPVEWRKQGDTESLFISILAEGAPAGTPGYFEVFQEEYPHRLVLHLYGVRGVAPGEIQAPERSSLVEDLYLLVTLDDASQRLVLTFKDALETQVSEARDPAGILIEMKPGPEAGLPRKYSLRTLSLGYGEEMGALESVLLWDYDSPGARQLKDKDGLYFVEEGLYASEGEALSRKAGLESLGFEPVLVVEEVGAAGARESIR